MQGPVHASVVAVWSRGAWRGIAIRGPSGAGKSDLALRLIREGARLVADDRVSLWSSGGSLYGRVPDTIRGLVEVRGLGIMAEAALDLCRIELVVDLIDTAPERLPDPQFETLCGITVPRLSLDPRPASATTVVARAIEAL